MTKHADRDRSEAYWPPAATREPRVVFPLDDGDTGASILPAAPAGTRVEQYADLIGRLYLTTSDGGCHTIEDIARAVVAVADAEQQAVASENERLCLEVERLRRQEGGQTRAAQTAWRNADRLRAELTDERATVARVEALAAEWIGMGVMRSMSAKHTAQLGEELRAALAEPEPCPHTCSCTSDVECPHDCPCDGA